MRRNEVKTFLSWTESSEGVIISASLALVAYFSFLNRHNPVTYCTFANCMRTIFYIDAMANCLNTTSLGCYCTL